MTFLIILLALVLLEAYSDLGSVQPTNGSENGIKLFLRPYF